jgi:hypothetical protein
VRFLSSKKTQDWIARRRAPGNALLTPGKADGESHELQFVVTGLEPPKLIALLNDFVAALQSWRQCLVVIHEIELGHDDPNLYYRLRSSYGDRRLLEEAPGHVFLQHERHDLRTFILVCIVNAWDADIMPDDNYAQGQVSHDGWLGLRSKHEHILQGLEKVVTELKLQTRRL